MNPAYSVILFTTASGAGYGLLALLGLVGFNHGQASSQAFALTTTVHCPCPHHHWAACHPPCTSAILNGRGGPCRSGARLGCQREGVAAVATYPVALLFGATWSGLINAPALIKPLGLLTFVMCAVTVYCTAMIYRSLRTIRQWNHKLVVPVYLAFALATGATLLARHRRFL